MRFLTLVTTLAAAAPLMAAAPPTNALFADGGSPIVFVGGKKTPLGELAGSLGDAVSEEATRWAAAADSIDAGLHVVAGGRVLLVTHSTKRKLKRELALIGDTLELVDELLPARPLATNEGTDQPSARRMPDPSDDGILVLLQPKNDEEYGQLLEVVVEGERYLQAWKESARRLPGFTISRPAVAMWIELLDGQEEFDIRNELVHRLAHLAVAHKGRREGGFADVAHSVRRGHRPSRGRRHCHRRGISIGHASILPCFGCSFGSQGCHVLRPCWRMFNRNLGRCLRCHLGCFSLRQTCSFACICTCIGTCCFFVLCLGTWHPLLPPSS